MSKNTLRIQELSQKLEPLQKELFEAIKKACKDVAEKLNKTINPVYPVSVRVGIESMSFYTTSEASAKGLDYGDFGSEITLSNYYGMGNFENMENIFMPELGYASMGMELKNKDKHYQVTKFHVLHFLANDLINEGEFTQYLKQVFYDLRLKQKAVWKIEFELRPLIEEDKKAETEALKEACEKALKEGNWYNGVNHFYYVEKITPKKVTVNSYNKNKHFKKDVSTITKVGAIELLYNAKLTTDLPEELKERTKSLIH
jgi:hypothetical protein